MDEIEFAAWVDRVTELSPQSLLSRSGEFPLKVVFTFPPGWATPREYELANMELTRRDLRIELHEGEFPGGVEFMVEP
jgi:hypothetical protein